MRRDFLAAALGFLVGAAALAGGQEDDWELAERLEKLQEAIARLRQQERPAADRLPPMGPEGLELELFPVFDLTGARQDYRVPELDRESEHYFGGRGGGSRPCGTVEEMMELVRSYVWPASYEEGAAITAQGQTLLVVNKRAALADTARFLDSRRDDAHRCVALELEAVDLVAPQLYRRLAAGGATTLGADQVDALAQALADGTAKRVFGARTICFAGQRAFVWHGRQVAVLDEPRVEVAQEQAIDDPEVGVVNDGGWLAVRPTLADFAPWITLDVDARFDEIGPRVARETDAGRVDLPDVRRVECRTALTVENRAWALIGGGARGDGRGGRVLLLRATHLPRPGGVR